MPLLDFRRPVRLALLAFFALTLGLAGPLWADSVSNLSLPASNGIERCTLCSIYYNHTNFQNVEIVRKKPA